MRIRGILACLGMWLLLTCVAAAWEPGFYPLVDDHAKLATRTAKLEAEILTADCEVDFDGAQFDLGVGRLVKEGARLPQLFKPDELEFYFARHRRTGFVVVRFPSHFQADATAARVQSYFTRLHYTHLLLLCGHAFGVVVYKDVRLANR